MTNTPDFVPIAYFPLYESLPDAVVKSMTGNLACQFPLPTQCVLCAANHPLVHTGRIFYAQYELGRDSGPGWESCRYLVEVYIDCGGDGHVEYQLQGYALVTSEMMSAYLTAVFKVAHAYEFPQFKTTRHNEKDVPQ